MKAMADKNCSERTLSVGDFVYLKLQPYRQSSMALRKNLKLCSKFYGPFEVIEKIGVVAYKIKLPTKARIHPVFHVSQLKLRIGPTVKTSPTLPTTDLDGEIVVAPMAILDTRLIHLRNDDPMTDWLIQWRNLDPTDATWESAAVILQQFPDFQYTP